MFRKIIGITRSNTNDHGIGSRVAVTSEERSRHIQTSNNRDLGDQERDRGAWSEAGRHYRAHLEQNPHDAAIWVQFGHASKESNDYTNAEKAYRKAMDLMPDDADAALQLGHLLKLSGRGQDAIQAYVKALSLNSGTAAYNELIRLGQQSRADKIVARAKHASAQQTIYFQIMDLLHFLRIHKTPSGIQRVQLGIISYNLNKPISINEPQVEFVFNTSDDLRVWQVNRSRLRDVLNYLSSVEVDQAVLRRLIDAACDNGRLVTPGPGDSFVILGAFWGTLGNTPLMASLRSQGATLGCYVYDIIPITHPEYCVPELTISFTQGLCEALCALDFVVAISNYTAQELRRFIAKHNFPDIPIESVPLAHSLTGSQTNQIADTELEWTDAIGWLQDRDYILYVCTIEARKNHKYLYDIWKILMRQGIPVPNLVFAGRRGWHVDEFFTQLEESDYLDGTIHIVHDLSDTELEMLYRNCRFTVFPSIVEGWGLPVGESLTYGKLCVTSNTSSMPEVGGDLVEYIDPLNLRNGLDTFERLFKEPERVTKWEDRIRREFKPRTWDDVASDFLSTITQLHKAVPTGYDRRLIPRLNSGELFEVGTLTRSAKVRPGHEYAMLKRLIFDKNWYSPEKFGIWMKASYGSINFNTGLSIGEKIIFYMRVSAASNAKGVTLTVNSNTDSIDIGLHPNQSAQFRLKAITVANGDVSATFKIKGDYDLKLHSPRIFCVGLLEIAFAFEKDAVARAELLEHFIMDKYPSISSNKILLNNKK